MDQSFFKQNAREETQVFSFGINFNENKILTKGRRLNKFYRFVKNNFEKFR